MRPSGRRRSPLGWCGRHRRGGGVAPAPPVVGQAFCFLPLPTETGLPVHINGFFELSSNRRDIWHGRDMAGAGQLRSEWNVALLEDVVAPSYSQMLLLRREGW